MSDLVPVVITSGDYDEYRVDGIAFVTPAVAEAYRSAANARDVTGEALKSTLLSEVDGHRGLHQDPRWQQWQKETREHTLLWLKRHCADRVPYLDVWVDGRGPV